MYFRVKYYYLATGMEGRADKKDYGVVEASTPKAAKDIVVLREYPEDIPYGPDGTYSTREFFMHCLSATPVSLK